MNCSVVSVFTNLHCADFGCLYSVDFVAVTKPLKNDINLPINTFFTTYLKSGGRETKKNSTRESKWKKVKNHCPKGTVDWFLINPLTYKGHMCPVSNKQNSGLS